MLLSLWSGFWDWQGAEPDNGWLGGGGDVPKAHGAWHIYYENKKKVKKKLDDIIDEFKEKPDNQIYKIEAAKIINNLSRKYDFVAPVGPTVTLQELIKLQNEIETFLFKEMLKRDDEKIIMLLFQ